MKRFAIIVDKNTIIRNGFAARW